MGFRTGAWAHVFEITPGEKSTKLRINVSKKNKQTGEYEQDFGGYVTLAGTAHRDAGNIKVGDNIKIGDCDVSNRYDKEKKVTYTNFTIFTFETNEQSNSKPAEEEKPAETTDMDAEDSEELPFN